MKTAKKVTPRTRGAEARGPSRVVAVGGSAGSLEALEIFFAHIPRTCGAAFVVVTHRDPREKSMIAELLGRYTPLGVCPIEDGQRIAPDCLYVVPSDRRIALHNGRFELRERPPGPSSRTIDGVFRAIADACGEHAVSVLMSGMGSDGTLGAKAIKSALGFSMVQDPQSAAFPEMPQSAIEARAADVVGDPALLAKQLLALLRAEGDTGKPAETAASFDSVLAAVRAHTGHDFASYKRSTIERRIERRMNLHGIAHPGAYVDRLAGDVKEIDHLFDDLLIGVTSFFREPEMFEALKSAVHPDRRRHDGPFRVWVAGCATGEEAYSIAIALREAFDERGGPSPDLQIYATDLDHDAIERARRGHYPLAITAHVTPARLDRFFTRVDDGYRVKTEIRERIVFATQNLISDPPFTKLDLLSCRNVLIYLKNDLQRKLLPLFFHALRPGAVLVLGGSESIGGFEDGFEPLHARWKIFRRKTDAAGRERFLDWPVGAAARKRTSPAATPVTTHASLPTLLERAIVEHVAPPVVVVDAKGDVVFASQRMGKFFEHAAGSVSLNVFTMARGGLSFPLKVAVREAVRRKGVVREEAVRVRTSKGNMLVDIAVWHLREPGPLQGLVMIAVAERTPPKSKKKKKKKAGARGHAHLKGDELDAARKTIAALTDEMDRAREEHESTNEELQSTNEELQSANEELTTSKEEMQSMNEELLTLNAELHSKNEELAIANDDMRNLLNSSQIPTLFLDNELRLKRFTTQATRIANVLPGDVGRPITDITLNVGYETLGADLREVVETLVFKEKQVSARDGTQYTMRIHPYRTIDNVIDGVVVTFLDVTALQRDALSVAERRQHTLLERLVADWPGIAWVEDCQSLRSVAVSRAASTELGYDEVTLKSASREFWLALRHAEDRNLQDGPIRVRRSDASYAHLVEETTTLVAASDGRALFVLHTLRAQ